jgi:hypothetical protein
MRLCLTTLRLLIIILLLIIKSEFIFSQGTCPVQSTWGTASTTTSLPFDCWIADDSITGPNTFRFSIYMKSTAPGGTVIPLRTFQGGIKLSTAFINTGSFTGGLTYVSRIFASGGTILWSTTAKVIQIAVNGGVSCGDGVGAYQYQINDDTMCFHYSTYLYKCERVGA